MTDTKRLTVLIIVALWCLCSLPFAHAQQCGEDQLAANTIVIKKKAVTAVSGGVPTIAYETSAETAMAYCANTCTINKPANTAEGDLMIAILTADGAQNATLAGWTGIAAATFSANGLGLTTLYREAGAGEGANYAFDFGAATAGGGCILRFSKTGGAWAVAPNATEVPTEIGVTESTTSSITLTAGSILITIYINDGTNTVSSSPPDMTARSTLLGDGSNTCAQVVYTQTGLSGAITKALTWGTSDEAGNAAVEIELQ